MLTIEKEKLEVLFEGINSTIYLQEESKFGMPVIVKVSKHEHPTLEQIEIFYNEYEISRNLDIQGVRRVFEKIDDYEGSPALVFEYVKGVTLLEAFKKRGRGVKNFLELAIEVTEILGEIHQCGVIHKDLNVRNILVEQPSEKVKIIDFGIATRFSLKASDMGNPEKLEGTLAYLSPEQTGRMNRIVDHRSDLYSLGIIFYELLAGKLPFEMQDAMELVHAHLAQNPVPLTDLDGRIPPALSDIVLKLLRKNAEDRYQSATGLRYDLEECLRQWQEGQRILEFPLATRDFSGKLQIPQKLYGRENETSQLLRAFDRICQGPTELWFVSGYSGVGKSALIHELHKPITEKRGYFVEGKFDQFQKSVPYYAWIQAFKSWVTQILAESSDRLRFWRNKILKAVGGNGKILTDVIPAIEHIIGVQPPLAELGASESQNRFNYVFQSFVNIISKKDHPLVMFIDDWQWADSASLELLKIILENYEQDYMLILGAYRSNEVTETHPLSLSLEEMERENIQVNDIKLKNLDETDVLALLKDTLHPNNQPLQELSALLYQKTQGNPFFVNQMLKSFYEDDLLMFDWASTSWKWDMERLNLTSITDNVVELMATKVQKLPATTQDVLKLASCIGNRFNTHVLAPLYEEMYQDAPRTAINSLEPALLEGMLIPSREDYQFAHDRIQQAVYAMLSEPERKGIHLQIGKVLVSRVPKAQQEEYLFDIVHHWNEGLDFVKEDTDKQFLAHLNVEAGKKARASSAFAPAFQYLRTAIRLLPENIWETDYEFALEVYCEMMQVTFLCGELEMTQNYINTVITNGKSVFDKMPAYEIVMQYHIAQGDNQAAINAGIEVVELLNITLNRFPLPDIDVKSLYDLPDIEDLKRKAAMEIMDSVITPAWASNPDLFRKITYTMVNISVAYGNSPSACVGYAFYGGLLCGSFGDIELGYEFGKLAVTLLDKYDARFFKAKVENLYISTVMHWKEPLRDTRKRYFDAIQVGLETGEIEFACYNIAESCLYQFLMGLPLEALASKFGKERSLIQQYKQEFHENYIAAYQQLITELLLPTPSKPTQLVGEFFDEDKMLPIFEHEKQLTLSFVSYQAKYLLAYLFRDYRRAYKYAQEAERHLDGVAGTAFLPYHACISSLIMMGIFPDLAPEEKPKILDKVSTNLQQLKAWSKANKFNYQHLADLVQAELYRLSGMNQKAMDHYDLAIDNARLERFLWVEALANELAAEFYFSQGKEKIGKAYLSDAAHRYQLWGAERKLWDIEQRYEKYLKARNTNANPLTSTTQTIMGGTTAGTNSSLDMASIIKASQTLSGEVKLESLLHKMMHIVIENAGAERGLFVLPDATAGWVIQAECRAGSEEVDCMNAIPIESANGVSDVPKLSSEAIYYAVRTRNILVLNDATNERSIIGLTYIQKVHPKSILCMPLLYQGNISGILYLENNLTTDAFTPERLEVLEILASQITISVENALMYENLEGKVTERTAELNSSKAIIEKKNEDITASINYAKRIQDASLPRIDKIRNKIPESFIFFKPREIVSGDFYWYAQTEPKPIYDEVTEYEQKRQTVIGFEPAKTLITAVDCTGHGVPGAFMSLIGNNLLNEIVISKGITSPEIILQELHKGVRNALQQAETDNKDGMDMALCVIDEQNKIVEFAGAKNPLIYIQNGQLHEIKADKMPIGGSQKEKERTFTKHNISINSPTFFYIFSDGFQDQFGGAEGRKFMIKYMKELLLEIYKKPVDEQKRILAQAIEDWMLYHPHEPQRQIDDILVIGFKVG
jgi:predicted ATPase/GAF domain-containing protein/tRNA A-37 threonylcarbamoyl transferase component Bud32